MLLLLVLNRLHLSLSQLLNLLLNPDNEIQSAINKQQTQAGGAGGAAGEKPGGGRKLQSSPGKEMKFRIERRMVTRPTSLLLYLLAGSGSIGSSTGSTDGSTNGRAGETFHGPHCSCLWLD